ncbi:translocon-associated protein subunit alpha-like [Erpetoichthys calabaricus]|uniref:translocon-associated protein subunit alpha-like n=1 Tax=Erpetoichthys calabaricus TaxID=27687 RepID=UPI002234130A|nr:translocon-associated protein subunit alpha-like [Erpetoichthys calabaricus]
MLLWSVKLLLLLLFTLHTSGSAFTADDFEHAKDSQFIVEEDNDNEEQEEILDSETDASNRVDESLDAEETTSHPDADTTIMFVSGQDFPANAIADFLVGFTNKGEDVFTMQSLEASFRYPQDFQFYIQNFTALPLNIIVQPDQQATFQYSFIPDESMAGRPFGLVILLNYVDNNGKAFQNTVYNQTVTISEIEEGLDGETIFMYMFLAGLMALIMFGLYHALQSQIKKRPAVKVETGTRIMNDVDISWIPQEALSIFSKSSPKASPRKRTKRAAGVDQ